MKTIRMALARFDIAALTCVAACALGADNTAERNRREPEARTYVFECADGSDFVVRATAEQAWIFRAGSSLQLKRLAGTAPIRYANNHTQLAIDGENGKFAESHKNARTCRNNRQRAVWEHAKLNGVDFRAVGNEPPWVLEIREQGKIVLVTEYGATRTERSLPYPSRDSVNFTTTWDTGDLQIEVTAAACYDSVSGENFASRVVVRWKGETLDGCGRALH